MNFLGVGPAELIVILVVALIFVGPERLPRLAADLARTIREIRKYTGNLAAEFNEVIQDFEKETEGERGQWKEIGEGLTSATKSVTDAFHAARQDAEAAPAQPPPADDPPASADEPASADAPAPNWAEIAEPPAPVEATPSTNGAAAAAATEPR
jgi:sec-independent protein translocase protein TatB